MSLSLGLALVILAIVVWIITLVRRSRPFSFESLDVVILLLLALYFR